MTTAATRSSAAARTAPRPPTLGATPSDASGAEQHVDPRLVEETKLQIRSLVQEIAQLAQAQLSRAEFFDAFLNRVVAALAAVSGAVWRVDDGEGGKIALESQVNLAVTGLAADRGAQARHGRLLQQIVAGGRPALVGPRSGTADPQEAGNPTELLLIVGLLVIDGKVRGLVEVFQRPGSGPATQRGYQRFVAQMCDLAADFLQSSERRALADEQQLWRQMEGYLRSIHRSLDLAETAYAIANDSRPLIGCDRVSVGRIRGGTCEILAVSGLESIDRRANTIARLEELCGCVAATNEPFWHHGDLESLPPQIEAPLSAYVDISHVRQLGILPVREPATTQEGSAEASLGALCGVLIVEHIQSGDPPPRWEASAATIAEASGAALAHAEEHGGIFLLTLWKTLGRIAALFDGEALPRTASLLALLAGLVLALVVVPWDFELAGDGRLEPEVRQEVFAPQDGEVVELLVDHGAQVAAGSALMRLRNTDLEVQLASLLGQRTALAEQILALERALVEGGRQQNPDEQTRVTGEIAQLRKTDESLERQIALLRAKEQQLLLRSPLAGQVTTWQLRETLLMRPVGRGQSLLTVVDPAQNWELLIDMPESRMGHIAQAAKQSDGPLKVTFVLATHPGQQFTATVREIHSQADVDPTRGNTVRLRAALDKSQLPELRPGAAVLARVHCGQRPLGYVLFHDVIAFVQAKVLFWL